MSAPDARSEHLAVMELRDGELAGTDSAREELAQSERLEGKAGRLVITTGSRFGGPSRAIRRMCLHCAGTSHEVRLCHVPGCHLWPFRFGTKPERAEARGEIIDPARFDEVVAMAAAREGEA